ncbi:MAG: hypothetical protein IKK21_03345 [Clostridia bacterium]|nr:hypothetical protein [Clostridia bacterium]
MHHPLMRGNLLAFALVIALTLSCPVDASWGMPLATAVMMAVGAFLAAVPGRILRRKQPRPKLSWRRCVAGFLGGLGVAVGTGLAGGSLSLQGILALGTGGAGSAAFILTAVLTAMLGAWHGRREEA